MKNISLPCPTTGGSPPLKCQRFSLAITWDADTNACVAGSLLGAKFGFNSIPKKYVIGLNKREILELKYHSFIEKLDEKLVKLV